MTYTWEQAKHDSDVAEQMEQQLRGMGWQYVEHQARRGAGLIELKETTPHGEFMANYQRAGILKRTTANTLMELARHMPLLVERRPESQADALRIIKAEQPPKPKAIPAPTPKKEAEQEGEEDMKNFGTGLILVLTGLSDGNNSSSTKARKELVERFGDDALDTKDKYLAAAKQLAAEKKCESRFDEMEKIRAEIETLSKSQQLRIAKLEATLLKKHELEFDKRVREAAKDMIPDLIKRCEEREAEATAEFRNYATRKQGIKPHLTEADYRFLRQTVAPDRYPDEYREKLTRAAAIINQFDKYTEAFKH